MIGSELGIAEARGYGGGNDEHGAQGEGAHEERHPVASGSHDTDATRRDRDTFAARHAQEDRAVGEKADQLGDSGCRRAPTDAPAEPEHEDQAQHQVDDDHRERDIERRARVLKAAQHAHSREDAEDGGEGDRDDAQVGDGV